MSNDNRPETRNELVATNHALRTSLEKCEAIVDEFRKKLTQTQAQLGSLESDTTPHRRDNARR